VTRRARALTALFALFALPASAVAAKAPAKAPAKADWVHTFGVTPEGGFRMGNPKAKIAIVEYGSLTCSHCRHFAETAMKPLVSQYVGTGKASYEFRSFVLNGIDLAATLVARCNGPAHFFTTAGQLFATQPEWIDKFTKLPKDEQDRLDALPENQLMLAIAKAGGLLPIAAAHGIPAARAEACLKNDAAAAELMKMAQSATDLGIQGTPTFFVNGKQVPAYDWATLEPFLKESGG
jgi:protein-disulfide isomerase